MTAGPLAGVTVVALEQAIAAPMCSRTLADFGARVIKVERPDGGDFARDYASEVVAHPQLAARNRWRDVDTPAGPIRALLPPPTVAGYEPPMGAVPGLGQHTDAVLAEFGLSAAEIGTLRERGAIGAPYASI
jgi:crotonobetainyl-CoA:carnitine CoA-transferase CaiB-like acyl-CoA transferase